jgi:hypothetical protein
VYFVSWVLICEIEEQIIKKKKLIEYKNDK